MTGTETSTTRSRINWRAFHWIVAAAFFAMLITGIIIYTPAFSGLASGAWTRLIHRIAAVVLIGAPIVYAVINPKAARQWLREAAVWNRDVGTSPHVLNTWKRRHKLIISVGYILLAATGVIQWFLKGVVPSSAFNVSLFVHDILFFSAILLLLYHVYFELYWWRWKRKYCARCSFAACAEACTVGAIATRRDSTVVRDPQRCNGCRLCMELCQRKSLFRAATVAVQTEQS